MEESFAQLLGRQPSDKERQDIYRARDALKLKNNDAVWLLVMILGHYETLYAKFPALIAQAAKEATKNVREVAAVQVQAAAEETKRTLALAVAEAATASARQAAGAQMWKWAGGCVLAATLCLLATGWWAFSRGRSEGFANGWSVAKQECANAAAAASWANTPEGQLAYGLAQAGSVRELATCSGRGWVIERGSCFPQLVKGQMYGWRLPADGARGGGR